jgi:murein L,D-transpeptidase YcbB/YkuD
MITTTRKHQASECKQSPVPAKAIRCIAFMVALFGSTHAMHAATTAGDVQPGSQYDSKVVNDNSLPGVAIPGEALLVQSIYSRAGLSLLWSRQGQLSAQARALIDILNAVESLGLRPRDYAAVYIAATAGQLNNNSSTAEYARFDHLLTKAAVRFISHVHYGRVNPRAAGFEFAASRNDLDVAATVAALASALNVAAAVAATEPQFYHYGLLKSALVRYRALQGDPNLTKLQSLGRRTIHPGDAYAGTPALRKLLMAERDLSPQPENTSVASPTLDAALVEGLKRFQDRHGLGADGALGASTYEALTTPMAQRVRQIELTLERWRWIPAFDTPPIIVNIPEFRLFAFNTTADRAASILQMPVIVGQTYPSKRTPVFVGDLKLVIFRPYWDVPRSITRQEMLPQIRAHPDYLQRNNLEIVRGESDDAAIMGPTPETIAALAAGELRLRQRPGDDNALGLIKFLFPNAHNVYMHSTPAHRLFLASRRAFSHGCIRVSDPTALAEYVLRNTGENWDSARIDAALHDTKSLRVELRDPIHVMILYGTAMATEAGPVQFFDDIYEHDRKLEVLLNLRPVNGAAAAR